MPPTLKVPTEKVREPTARLGGGQDSKRGGQESKRGSPPKAAKKGAAPPPKGGKLGAVAEEPPPQPTKAAASAAPTGKTVMTATGGQKKIEFLTEELMYAAATKLRPQRMRRFGRAMQC